MNYVKIGSLFVVAMLCHTGVVVQSASLFSAGISLPKIALIMSFALLAVGIDYYVSGFQNYYLRVLHYGCTGTVAVLATVISLIYMVVSFYEPDFESVRRSLTLGILLLAVVALYCIILVREHYSENVLYLLYTMGAGLVCIIGLLHIVGFAKFTLTIIVLGIGITLLLFAPIAYERIVGSHASLRPYLCYVVGGVMVAYGVVVQMHDLLLGLPPYYFYICIALLCSQIVGVYITALSLQKSRVTS